MNIVYGIPNDIPVAGHWAISSPAPHNSLIVLNTALPVTVTATPTHPSIRLTQPGTYRVEVAVPLQMGALLISPNLSVKVLYHLI